MSRVLATNGQAAADGRAIMTVDTGADHLRVIDHIERFKQLRILVMASITFVAGIDMIAALAQRNRAVMTTHAIANERTVIRHRGRTTDLPIDGGMAGVAFRGGDNVIRSLADGNDAVVATATGAQHIIVIHLLDLGK